MDEVPNKASINCFLCDKKSIGSNEHIIPDSLGGRLTTNDFICRGCNNKYGSTWDSSLQLQLSEISAFFDIRSLKNNNEKIVSYSLENNSHLHYSYKYKHFTCADNSWQRFLKKDYVENGKYSFSFSTKKEANRFSKNLNKKFGDNVSLEANIKESFRYPKSDEGIILSLSIGGEKAGRSMVKTAAAYANYCKIPSSNFSTVKDYLLGDSQPCFGWFNKYEVLSCREFDFPIHVLGIYANKKKGKLFGYIEYFGCWRILVVLNDSYIGDDIMRCQVFNAQTGFINESINLDGSVFDNIVDDHCIQKLYDYEYHDNNRQELDIFNLIQLYQNYGRKKEVSRIADNATKETFNELSLANTNYTSDEIAMKLANKFATEYTKYYIYLRDMNRHK